MTGNGGLRWRGIPHTVMSMETSADEFDEPRAAAGSTPPVGERRNGLARTGSGANHERVGAILLYLLAIGAGYLLVRLLWPFLPAFVTSAVIAVLVFPAYRTLRARVRHAPVAAFVTTVIVFFLVLLPAIGLALLLLDQIRGGLGWIAGGANDVLGPTGGFREWFVALLGRLGFESTGVAEALSRQTEGVIALLAERTLALFTGLGGWLLQAGVALFTLYYMLRDGEALVAHVKWLVPLEPELRDRLFDEAHEVTHATIYGNVVVALVQGTLGGLAFWALGLTAPILWGTVMGVLSLLPVVGAFFVWLPAGIVLIVNGNVAQGVFLLLVGTFVISTVDNVLRAVLVGGRAQLHPLVVFFSVLGGLFVFGAVGVFVGPVLFVLSLMLVEMARLSLESTDGASAVTQPSNPWGITMRSPSTRPLRGRWRAVRRGR